MGGSGGVRSRLRTWFAGLAVRRRALRRRLTGLGRDALVALAVLALVAVVVGAAAYALAVGVSNGGIAGLVLGWTAAFAFAISLPVLVLRTATAAYERFGG
jgi:uncharacterized RDD family membrane protein YckC